MVAAIWNLVVLGIPMAFQPSFLELEPSEAQARTIGMLAAGPSFACLVNMIWGIRKDVYKSGGEVGVDPGSEQLELVRRA